MENNCLNYFEKLILNSFKHYASFFKQVVTTIMLRLQHWFRLNIYILIRSFDFYRNKNYPIPLDVSIELDFPTSHGECKISCSHWLHHTDVFPHSISWIHVQGRRKNPTYLNIFFDNIFLSSQYFPSLRIISKKRINKWNSKSEWYHSLPLKFQRESNEREQQRNKRNNAPLKKMSKLIEN